MATGWAGMFLCACAGINGADGLDGVGGVDGVGPASHCNKFRCYERAPNARLSAYLSHNTEQVALAQNQALVLYFI